MPQGKGTYGSQVGRPKKYKKGGKTDKEFKKYPYSYKMNEGPSSEDILNVTPNPKPEGVISRVTDTAKSWGEEAISGMKEMMSRDNLVEMSRKAGEKLASIKNLGEDIKRAGSDAFEVKDMENQPKDHSGEPTSYYEAGGKVPISDARERSKKSYI
tara:strand:- start:72 stop:539 length:468 start_codon:yes stop_codon:yes gene_type:complete